jgi:hypothetical protein
VRNIYCTQSGQGENPMTGDGHICSPVALYIGYKQYTNKILVTRDVVSNFFWFVNQI